MTMRPLFRGYALFILCTIAMGVHPPSIWSQQSRRGGIRPAVDVVLSTFDVAILDDAQMNAVRLLQSTVEGRLRTQRRYEIARLTGRATPEEYVASLDGETAVRADGTVFLTLASRRDRGVSIEVDVWDGERFRWSGVEVLPTDDSRFAVADDIARRVSREVAALFPGFARVRFTNTGRRDDYYVYVDETLLGTNIGEIELLVGEYEIDVRVRDERFEYAVGRREVTLLPDDFIDIRFAVGEVARPPDESARAADERRPGAILDVEVAHFIPSTGLAMFENADATSVTTRALFTGVFVPGFVLGVETGIAYGETTFIESDITFDIEYDLTRLMGTTGFMVGPTSGVDFVIRASGGTAFVRSEVRNSSLNVFEEETDWYPAFGFSTELGFGLVGPMRLAVRTSWFAFVDGDTVLSWSTIGIGLGELVGDVAGPGGRPVAYAAFVAPALLGASAMNGAILESTFNIFFKL
ncbi:MAG: hypothetical protein MI724_09705, partial [Spirochaetales bacterium]|nr:hypothetical protein [Spirochaetales bacterium]